MIEPESIFAGGVIEADVYQTFTAGAPRPLVLGAFAITRGLVTALPVAPAPLEVPLDAWITREVTLEAWIVEPGEVETEPALDDVLLTEDGDSLLWESGDDWELEEAA